MLKRNLIANYLGQGWAALMGLAFIPLYIKYLGIESYGLIGLFAILTAWSNLLDMGLTPTLGREMARYTAGSHSAESIRDLLRSIEFIAVAVAFTIVGMIALGSEWLATSWIRSEMLPREIVAQALTVMGMVTALRFIESIYRSAIMGLQRQVLFNIISSAMSTVRWVGALAILVWVAPTIQAFFLWQGAVSIVTLVILFITTYSCLQPSSRIGHFSLASLRGVWRFAGGMMGITFLALLLTQVDKILLSKLISLLDYGHYTLAAVVAGGLYLLVSPVTQAWFPRLSQLHAENDHRMLIHTYHQGAQLISIVAGSAALMLIFYAETLLNLWTQDTVLSHHVAPLVRLLALGNLLNALMYIPYQTQLAHGWTTLAVKINVIAVMVVIPCILWATPRYGAEGAAWTWVGLNAAYVLVGVHFMYKRILTTEKWRWYTGDVLAPIIGAFITIFGVKLIWPNPQTILSQTVVLAIATLMALGGGVLAASKVRDPIANKIRHYFA